MSLSKDIKDKYYENYKGPNLTIAQIWKKGQERIDITTEIKELYGENNNWNQQLYSYEVVFPGKDSTHHFYVEFHSDDGRKHWFHGMVGEKNQIFNPPLATPMNQI